MSSFPSADSKVRSNACNESCGGNASNTAIALSILKEANIFSNNNNLNNSINGGSIGIGSIKLISKIGNDVISKQLLSELALNTVNILHPTLASRKKTTISSSVTTVIVSEDINERCCIHTPGECGELTENELLNLYNDNNNNNVIHLHCDTRHTKATLKLAYEIRNEQQKNTIISIDLEKDRGIHMDKLVTLADIIFTNENYISKWISKNHLLHLINDTSSSTRNSFFLFAHDYFQNHEYLKEIIITRGKYGSLCIYKAKINIQEVEEEEEQQQNYKAYDLKEKTYIEYMPNKASFNMYKHKTISTKNYDSDDEDDNINVTITKYEYKVKVVGILSNVSALVKDTTGAGDSFIAGYILMRTLFTNSNTMHDNDDDDESIRIKACLLFATWVAGNKIQGIGTSSIPKGDVINELFSNLSFHDNQNRKVNGKELQAILRNYIDNGFL